MAENQRLRWWQEEEQQTQAAREASERIAVAPSPLLSETAVTGNEAAEQEHFESQDDTWTELEVEAVRRASQAKVETSKSVSFYTDKVAALVHYRHYQRIQVMGLYIQVLFCLILTVVLARMLIPPFPFYYYLSPFAGSLFGILAMIPTYLYVKRQCEWVQKSEEPAVRLSPQGIHLCTTEHKNALLPWGDFVSVRRKGSASYGRSVNWWFMGAACLFPWRSWRRVSRITEPRERSPEPGRGSGLRSC